MKKYCKFCLILHILKKYDLKTISKKEIIFIFVYKNGGESENLIKNPRVLSYRRFFSGTVSENFIV